MRNENYAEIIEKELFEVMVPYATTITKNQKLTGTYDPTKLDVMVPATFTIEKLCEISRLGNSIEVINEKDVVRIYNVIQGHIRVVNEYHEFGGYDKVYPEEDLLILDEFAQSIYKVNDDIIVDDANKQFASSAFFGGGSLIPGVSVEHVNRKTGPYVSRVKSRVVNHGQLNNNNADDISLHDSLKVNGQYDVDTILGLKK